MRLIDADATIPMIKYATTDNEIGIFPIKIGYNDIVKVLNAQPTVKAIPVEWINKYTNEHRTYMHAFSEMVACWYDEKEQREYEMASDMRDYCEKYEPTYNPEDGSL